MIGKIQTKENNAVVICTHSLPPLNFKWWGHQTNNRVKLQEVHYLPALFMGCRVLERHLANKKWTPKVIEKAYDDIKEGII